ncbi:unnamed protein product [Rotaria sp. Silwood1]|nr:unnamed protein product [Rotaria sp. Silwood1]CAF3680982.1 unnamed protein product [Rotaria sp. Silwood1]CAF4829340.1 unnamed protein product [Rotaria sp. Silwood1]CAF4870706.1 unnamed protein product [Rotaria sp. Silwood1]
MILVPYVFILFFTAYLNPCETLKCYECTGHIPCGQGETHLMVDCAGKCMVYRNQYDGGTIIRRCCTNDCGQDGLGTYEGRDPTYFCSQDLCNGAIADVLLPGIIDPLSTTTTTSSGLTTNGGSSQQPSPSLSCYDCTGYNPQCGIDESTLIHSCQACMVYLNQFDGNMVIRRCCTSGCGLPGTISDYEGRVTYFCSSNRCNGIGTEATLTGGIVLTPVPTWPTSLSPIQTTTISVQSSFQCYVCSGSGCGLDGSPLSENCPSCMVYRNPDDPTIIERRCCWWACGLSNSISTYNGIQTYFCSNDKCNGYGTENILPPVITTTTSIISLTTTPITTSTCTLNCQNGGVLEIQNPCFCNCVDNTFGFECQYFNCARPDVNPQTCIPENQPLCWQSDIFAYECFHLCGKC